MVRMVSAMPDGTGVLRFAQDDSKNKQQQKQATAKTSNSKDK
jgi:hypothetical protein